MKKLLAIFFALVLLIGCSGCGNSDYHTHQFDDWELEKAPTCSEYGSNIRRCSCGYTERQTVLTTPHNYGEWEVDTPATCTASGRNKRVCSVCGEKAYELIMAINHDYVNGQCRSCGQKEGEFDTTTTGNKITTATTTKKTTTAKKTTTTTKAKPNVYGAGQKWVVAGKFEFTINAVYQHSICESNYLNNNPGYVTAVIIDYTWKNLGYSDKLSFGRWDLECYDSAGQEGDPSFDIYCDHEKEAGNVIHGGTGSATLPVALYAKNNGSVTIIVEKGSYSATFKIPVSPAPAEPDDPADDPLQGCTVKLDASLPQTYSYYDYNDRIKSSCSVTEASFEVSGDDLYIYLSGRKTYDANGSGQSDSCKIGWKLYDIDTNTVVATGTIYTLSIATGEGFVKAKGTAYNCIQPGGNYKVVLLNVN